MQDATRDMLSRIRGIIDENKKTSITPEEFDKRLITEEEEKDGMDDAHRKTLNITNSNNQFGDIYASQTEAIRKTISSNVKFGENALTYYPDSNDLTLDFQVPHLNISCQFRYADSSGSGAYLSVSDFMMNDENNRTLLKIFDAYKNWKDSIDQDSTLFEKLENYSKRN